MILFEFWVVHKRGEERRGERDENDRDGGESKRIKEPSHRTSLEVKIIQHGEVFTRNSRVRLERTVVKSLH